MDEALLVAVVGASGTLLGASIAVIGQARAARYAIKTTHITADNAARMQSEKLRHDTFLGEIAFKRGKLEELHQAVARATAYSWMSVAVFRSVDAPTPKQQLERYDEDMANIHRALAIAELYFDSLVETIHKFTA